jgi:hypothetical protein
LRGAGAKTVQPEGKLIILSLVVGVFASGIQLAINQLPIVSLLLGIVVHRATAAEVLHFDGLVLILRNYYKVSVAFLGLVYGV